MLSVAPNPFRIGLRKNRVHMMTAAEELEEEPEQIQQIAELIIENMDSSPEEIVNKIKIGS